MAFDTDTTQLDHLVKAFDFIEGFLQGRSPVLSVADKELLNRTYHANRESRSSRHDPGCRRSIV
jgi:hypothetical protein